MSVKGNIACILHCPPPPPPSGVGGAAAKHPAAGAGPARDQVEGDAPRLQPLLPRGEAGVVVAVHRRPAGSDPRLRALPRVHATRHRRGEHVSVCGSLWGLFTEYKDIHSDYYINWTTDYS